jgi:Tfp pilus assembly protein PilE
VICHACQQDNAANVMFCTACRRPLVAPAKLPTRMEPTMEPRPAPPKTGAAAGQGSAGFARERFAPPTDDAGPAGDGSAVLSEDEAWSAVIGDSNTDYYLTRFDRLSRGEGARWHWPAMLVTWYWLLYRKMWVGALVYFFAPGIILGVLAAMMPRAAGPLVLVWWLSLYIAPAMLANGWYYAHCRRKIRDVRARGGSKEQMLARLEAAGGTSNIVVIIVAIFGLVAAIGILAAIALPAYQTYTVKAKVGEAVLVGVDVAEAVGRQYEQTGTLPLSDEVDRLVAEAPHHSRIVREATVDRRTGVLTIRVEASPGVSGSILMIPQADDNRHLRWSCTTEDLKRYVPASCRGDIESGHP